MSRKVLALALVLFASAAFARVRAVASSDARIDSMGGTVTGTVSSVTGNLIQIANGAITIDASGAKISVGRGREGVVADIKAGMQLFAALKPANVSSHPVHSATVITVTDPADVTLSGPVQSVDTAGKSFMILSQVIATDANTSFGGYKREGGTSFADIQPNVIVHVSADAVNGKLIAREVLIVAPAPPQVGHARGTVQSIAADSWTVKTDKETLTLVVNAQTKIAGSPKVGDTVEVLYNINSANQYVAISIIKFERITPPVVENFHGTVKSISGNAWIVTTSREDKSFVTNESTKLVSGIAVGDLVNVTAVKREDGSLLALAILKMRM
jgi:hypothetical protein